MRLLEAVTIAAALGAVIHLYRVLKSALALSALALCVCCCVYAVLCMCMCVGRLCSLLLCSALLCRPAVCSGLVCIRKSNGAAARLPLGSKGSSKIFALLHRPSFPALPQVPAAVPVSSAPGSMLGRARGRLHGWRLSA